MEESAWQKRRNGQSKSIATTEPVADSVRDKKSREAPRTELRNEDRNSRFVPDQRAPVDLNPFSNSEDENSNEDGERTFEEASASADNNSDERSDVSGNSRSNLIAAEYQRATTVPAKVARASMKSASASGNASYGIADPNSYNTHSPQHSGDRSGQRNGQRYSPALAASSSLPSITQRGNHGNKDDGFELDTVYPLPQILPRNDDADTWETGEKNDGQIDHTNIELSLAGGNTPNNLNNPSAEESGGSGLRDYRNKASGTHGVNMIYHKNRMSEPWLYAAVVVHVMQFSVLLVLGRAALPQAALAVLALGVIAVAVLLLYSRRLVRKNKRREGATLFRKKLVGDHLRTPDEEMDTIPENAIYCLSIAAILEGALFALYTILVAGRSDVVDNATGIGSNPHGSQIILETLRFASITLLAFHRILRPANRVDPMRTMLELEVVCVCWDALDGSTLYQLLAESSLPSGYDSAARVMMAFWYISVGCRMAAMMLSHLSPTDRLYHMVLPAPLALAPQPTVDRTLQSLRLRSEVIMVMGAAELFAAVLRISLWTHGYLRNNSLQQEMAIKNILFLTSVYGAYSMWTTSDARDWNSRELGMGLRYPTRDTQRQLFRWLFILSYLLQGALLSGVLVMVSKDSSRWVVNVGSDLVFAFIFAVYCNDVHRQNANSSPSCCSYPQRSYVVFPSRKALIVNIIMAINMYAGRLPTIYYTYHRILSEGDIPTGWLSYDNVLLMVSFSVMPIAFAAMYWSISFMLFRREFTACPGNYNAIHDPTIGMVATATMIEGSLDVLSCSTLMQLAAEDLPDSINGAIVLFSLLELVNACQSFALQVLLSGGHDDTPLDLVKWKAYLRVARGIIDLGAFVLRIVLWVKYGSVSTVFLIKNLYNLLHTGAQIERWSGVWRYPKHTLFTEFVSPADWYGMSKEEWRVATSSTLVAQARAGRRV